MNGATEGLILAALKWYAVREAHDTGPVTTANDDDAVEFAAQDLESAIMRYDRAVKEKG